MTRETELEILALFWFESKDPLYLARRENILKSRPALANAWQKFLEAKLEMQEQIKIELAKDKIEVQL